jgi:predicted ATPase
MLPGSESVLFPLADDWVALKDAVKHFEHVWHQTPRPRIDDYIRMNDPLRSRVLIELVHIELELRLKAGEAARVEEYLVRYPELTEDRKITIELIAAEHELRRRGESDLSIDEYLHRFPQYRETLPGQIEQSTVGGRGAPGRLADARQDVIPEVGGYEVLSPLGRGGMGVVYAARQLSLNRLVALKFLSHDCARDPVWLERFRREARTASALNHPNICTIYDTGESGGRPYLSMELIEGQTLEALVGRRPAVDEVARIIGQAARALAAAHAAGVIHRDIKPANLMVRDDGLVKVLDFGLARRFPARGVQPSTSNGIDTELGTRVGTVLYMSPEQVRAELLEPATDIFSLGIILYELATGQHPFRADSDVSVLHAIVAQAPVPPARLNPEVPSSLEGLIQHMLAKDLRLRPTPLEVEATLAQLTATDRATLGIHPPGTERRPTVGRAHELAALRAARDEAAAGRGLLLGITGEPGLGKTTLVENFLDELSSRGSYWTVARGRCSERLAGAEAYLPFLEALDSLLQSNGGAPLAQAMKLLAPTWYVQLAPLAADDPSLAHVLVEARDAPQSRRKRELAMFLQEVSRQRPLVMFIDDIHWVDASSVDLLAYLGAKCSEWRFLLVLTYRTSDLLLSQQSFGPVKLELQGRGVCREISLPLLNRDDIQHYLALAFAGHKFPQELAAVLHARTEGNPLFMVDLLRYLRDRGIIIQHEDYWELIRAVPDFQQELPESVRSMIQRKIDQLSESDRRLLMAASVQGPEFDSTIAAQILGRDAAEVEERLDVLENVHALVRLLRQQLLPDGTLSLRYGFVHALYQNTLFAALQPTRKAAWSAAAARAILDHYRDKSPARAAELALLFEAARNHKLAAEYYRIAVENAAHVFAHHEAVALARRGLAQLETLANASDRARLELPLQLALGVQLQLTEGYAAPEAERTYLRARALCDDVPEAPLFLVLWGLWMFYEVSSHLGKSRELAEQLFDLAGKACDPAQMLQARMAFSVTFLSLGDPAATRENAEQGVALYDPTRHISNTYLYGQDPRVACLAFSAVSLWLLGYPDQAVERSRESVARGAELAHPTTRALSLYFATILRQYCQDAPAVQEGAETTAAIATEQGLSLWIANSFVMRGWALAKQGAYDAGIAMLRQGLADWLATGAETHRTYFLGLLAEVLGEGGRIDEALEVLAEALALVRGTGTVFHEAELHRLQGEFLLQKEPAKIASREAEACFLRAASIARRQQAKSLELRAATSLTRLYQSQNRQAEALPILAACYAWFTEGFETRDLQEAEALLKRVS